MKNNIANINVNYIPRFRDLLPINEMFVYIHR